MLEKNELKQVGLRYGRSLQTLLKTAMMFSPGHMALNSPLQHSFDQLNEIVKQLRQFTFGFVDQRVMVNNILTADPSLKILETEFFKRGIGAVTFEAGITMSAYRRMVTVMAASAKAIQEQGGLHAYLLKNPVEFARIIPAAKNQQRGDEDTILETDSESYLMSKALSDLRSPSMEKVDWFLQGAGIGGSGSGTAEGEGTGTGHGFGGGSGGGGLGGSVASGGGTGAATSSGPIGITGVVEGYFNSTVAETKDAPGRSYVELARIIAESRPEVVLASFSPQRREELRKLPPDEMAAEVIEDTAVTWAANRLAKAPAGPEGLIIEDQVVRVLLRSVQATQVASRLAQKLADHIKDLKIPATTTDRIRGELEWVVVPGKEKTRRLLQFKKFEPFQFRRLVSHIADLMKLGDVEAASQLAKHYISLLDDTSLASPETLARFPELVQTLAGLRSDFWQVATTRLCEALPRHASQPFLHHQVLNALVAISQTVARFEGFEVVEAIGTAIHKLASEAAEAHEKCCAAALSSLISTHVVERVLELYLQKRDDPAWVRMAANLLKLSGNVGIGKVFHMLEEEQSTANRLALIRLISRLGPAALQEARKSLSDSRWYVVRNACKLLGQLRDPELLQQLAPVLRHDDHRVQKAALDAVKESRANGRAHHLAEALPFLHPQLRDEVLDELLFLRDPECIAALDRLIFTDTKGSLQTRCTQIIAAMTGTEAEHALLHVLSSPSLDAGARRTALAALKRTKTSEIESALRQYAEASNNDPLSSEILSSLSS